MAFPEQALFHAFARQEADVTKDLESFEYASPELLAEAKTRLQTTMKELRNSFLSRTTPELNQLAKILNEVLAQFFTQELPPAAGELAWQVVKVVFSFAPARHGHSVQVPNPRLAVPQGTRSPQIFPRRSTPCGLWTCGLL